ncbi:MAG: DinB family protein [Leeuwenhoekiella sp.]
MKTEFITAFKESALYRIDESTRMITLALNEVDEEQVWLKPNAKSNSIGNIILHLCGNIGQYAVSSLGNLPDTRERNIEFAVLEGLSKEELLQKLLKTVEKAKEIIQNLPAEEFIRKRQVQAYEFSGIGVIMHVVEHYSYHTGQIAFWVKLLTEQDLGFYNGIDLTKKNQE